MWDSVNRHSLYVNWHSLYVKWHSLYINWHSLYVNWYSRGSAFGDSFSLLCLIFALTENVRS